MQLLYWSKWATIACLALWGVLITVYLVLGAVKHETLPPPYNLMIMTVLAIATVGSGGTWLLASRVEVRLGRIEGALLAAADRLDTEDTRFNAHLMRISKRLDELEAPTVQMPRLVAVGSVRVADVSTYRQGYEDAMAAKPDAKVIQLGTATPRP